MENQVPSDVAHRRSAILIADGKKVRKQRFEEKSAKPSQKLLFEA